MMRTYQPKIRFRAAGPENRTDLPRLRGKSAVFKEEGHQLTPPIHTTAFTDVLPSTEPKRTFCSLNSAAAAHRKLAQRKLNEQNNRYYS